MPLLSLQLLSLSSQNSALKTPQCPLWTYWWGGSFLTRYVNRLTDWLLVLPKVEAREPEFTHPLLLLDQCNVREFYYRLVLEGYFFLYHLWFRTVVEVLSIPAPYSSIRPIDLREGRMSKTCSMRIYNNWATPLREDISRIKPCMLVVHSKADHNIW